jgi:hypothetical protein
MSREEGNFAGICRREGKNRDCITLKRKRFFAEITKSRLTNVCFRGIIPVNYTPCTDKCAGEKGNDWVSTAMAQAQRGNGWCKFP